MVIALDKASKMAQKETLQSAISGGIMVPRFKASPSPVCGIKVAKALTWRQVPIQYSGEVLNGKFEIVWVWKPRRARGSDRRASAHSA